MAHEYPNPILYQNEDETITLIDVPQSICSAQVKTGSQCTHVLFSTPPLQAPYPSIEPRSEKAKLKAEQRLPSEDVRHQPFPHELLAQGLAEIRAERHRSFCYQRSFRPSDPHSSVKSRQGDRSPKAPEDYFGEPELLVSALYGSSSRKRAHGFLGPFRVPSSALSDRYGFPHGTNLTHTVITNPFAQQVHLHVADSGAQYTVPPLSTFLLSKVGHQEATYFSEAASKIFPEPSTSAAPGQFDLIILDPPWENRSVRRSRKYQTRRNVKEDPLSVLQSMLGKHIAPGALVACWITNKANVRATALETFQMWGVSLIEEWVWLKTTVHGEPICVLDGIMRRPYETLLVGKSVDAAVEDFQVPDSVNEVKRRVIVGVPDLHSRKPCLKALFEPMMQDASNYRALEIFARHLTAEWWSWGDEVLKYNWDGHWTEPAELDSGASDA
ncbi:MAG: hypothetical protein Q9174_003298 [Haloplaca sp. 1 TL-2023]